ncbi:MAG: 7-cyano-7-deazaguanine synthase QueC [Candidatus Omnitrophota bacterium]|jgi:7-cyano-7-deazaguanine synthase
MKNKKKGLALGKRAIVLLSGGLDSATTLYYAKRNGFDPYCLVFDYGQRHQREITAARGIARALNAPLEKIKIAFPWKGSSLLDKSKSLPQRSNLKPLLGADIPSTYVPARNIIFLSFALSYAEVVQAEAVFIGAHAQDYSGYPDCRPEFYRAFDTVIKTGTKAGVEGHTIKVITPLINKTKSEIIKLGFSLGVPFERTWSCYHGGKRPCGKCDSCYYRGKGFVEAGLEDPL